MPSDGQPAALRAGDMLLAIKSSGVPAADEALAGLSRLLGCLEAVRCFPKRALLVEACEQGGLQPPEETPAGLWICLPPERLSTVLSALLQLGFPAPLVEGRLH